jgi:EAL domain-containing protein (putative c-di-GMP-specific phosphodiesterase class I)
MDLSRYEVLQPDILKLDVARSEGFGQSATQRQALEQAAHWCEVRERDLVIEGVERDEERNRLHALGCSLFQDCLFTSPGRKLSRS